VIWQACNGEQHIKSLSGRLYRLVESQEQAATLSLVDTLEEQALLEQMLEQTKPALPKAANGLHYLLKTPFRYPPLKWGSRFGAVDEPGIFYGGCSVTASLAESAYYRLLFWHSIDAPPIKPVLRSAHTLFSVTYRTKHGVCLQQPPFSQYHTALTDKTNYCLTQQLGSAMRAADVAVFEYPSARTEQPALCVGLFSPAGFGAKQPDQTSQWLCELNAGQVLFKQAGDSTVHQFSATQFLVAGSLPLPA
jgi:hypothetical protein